MSVVVKRWIAAGGKGIGARSNYGLANEISADRIESVEFSSADDESSAVVMPNLHFSLKTLVAGAGFCHCRGLKNSGCGDVAGLLDSI